MRRLALLCILLSACKSGSECQEMTVLAAQSLEVTLGPTLGRERGVRISFGASGTLLRQLESGSPAGLFLSAGEREAGEVSRTELAASSPVPFARGRLVVIVPEGAPRPASLADLTSARYARIAMGDPGSVPAGHYAAQALEHVGLSGPLAGRLVLGESVAQPLLWVRSGEADAGFVYATDAAGVPGVQVALEIPDGDHDPIRYLAVPIRGACQKRASATIQRLISGDLAQSLRMHGFAPP